MKNWICLKCGQTSMAKEMPKMEWTDGHKCNFTIQLRWVFGTKSNQWHLVNENDRDYAQGINEWDFRNMSEFEAKAMYLKPIKI